ncbi:MAG: serine hydroxymethyltransferase [Pseudomonadota bacterium]|nr:serine hydroxymethyltransferase [Pseudomonadota bacterium]
MPPDEPGQDKSGAPGAGTGAGETYIEFKQVGQVMRVSAIDAATGTEVVIMGPASASPGDLQKVAVAKLRRRLEQDRQSGES